MSRGSRSLPILLAGCLLAAVFGSARAQVDDPLLEGRLLQSATELESEGSLGEAERVLRDLLAQRPTSAGALFALERVLRAQDRVAEVVPAAERYRDAEPSAAAPRSLLLRVLVEVGDEQAAERQAEDWLQHASASPDAYLEVSAVYARSHGTPRALALLRQGRVTLADSTLFAMEVGDLLADLGRSEEAVREWASAIGDEGAQTSAVMRRVGELEGDRAALARPLVESLSREPTTLARRRAASRIAVEAGLIDEARTLAAGVIEELDGQPRRGFLSALAQQVEEVGGAPELALWAYRALHDHATDATEARALDHRIADAALAAGDTAAALAAQRSVAAGLPEGSAERRRAVPSGLTSVKNWPDCRLRSRPEWSTPMRYSQPSGR